jgi:hypothetical protein
MSLRLKPEPKPIPVKYVITGLIPFWRETDNRYILPLSIALVAITKSSQDMDS